VTRDLRSTFGEQWGQLEEKEEAVTRVKMPYLKTFDEGTEREV
jgi:hypothetical protein